MSHHPIHKHMHTHITKGNVKAAIRDDKAHMTYLKEDVDKDQKYGGKYKDENQTADEKHISKLAGDVKHDEGVSRKSSSPLNETNVQEKKNLMTVKPIDKRAEGPSRISSSPLNNDEHWIQDATASIQERGTEGKCTPISKPGCTGKARTLALTFHKMAKNR